MQAIPQPIVQDLVLIGGGHSHAIVLKQFGMHPIAGVQLTLITDVYHTPYSGMLPGYVAGLYSLDDCHIDLRPLAQFAGATLIASRATGLDLKNRSVQFADRPPLRFDWLSIDIGSTPTTATVPGAADHAIPVKPISQFLDTWDHLVATVQQQAHSSSPRAAHPPLRLAIVGGGAGGVELALSVEARLRRVLEASSSGRSVEVHLFHQGTRLVPERGRWLGDRLSQLLTQRGIHLHLQESVIAIESVTDTSNSAANQTEISFPKVEDQSSPVVQMDGGKRIRCQSGYSVDCDVVFWVTQASAASWLRQSGLATNDRGFVAVDSCLQSISHPGIFAAGDVATMVQHPRPKAGVFAVRQGKPLYHNLRRSVLGAPLQPFTPQSEFLILVGTGQESALASRGGLGLGPYPWIWRWKDWIDRRFMNQFHALDPMPTPVAKPTIAPSPPPVRPCAGCGSKLGGAILDRVLHRLRSDQVIPIVPEGTIPPEATILVGLDAPDDAAVLQLPADRLLVQTVDQFRALLTDPFVFGQIAANHCLSDLWAMGATPHSALALATLPYATEAIAEAHLYQLLAGAVQVLQQAGAVLIGGHTTTGSELAFGLSCNGLVRSDQLWRKEKLRSGQRLILTKAIGTGTLFAADMQLRAKGRWIEGAIASMQQSNQAAATCLRQFGTTACTDVTGFGLVGHSLELLRAARQQDATLAIELDLQALPILEGAVETAEQGWLSSLHPANQQLAEQSFANLSRYCHHPHFALLFDPQTSGGLLASVPADQADACMRALRSLGYGYSRVIGRVVTGGDGKAIELQG